MADEFLIAKVRVEMGVWQQEGDGASAYSSHRAGDRCYRDQIDLVLGCDIAAALKAVAPGVALRALGHALMCFEEEEETRNHCSAEDYAVARKMVIAGSKLTGISYWNNPDAEEV